MLRTVRVNPRGDLAFVAEVDRLLSAAETPDELKELLRVGHPRAEVTVRLLSGEDGSVWYVYREGHWVSSA